MGTFMESNKRIVAKSVNGNVALQLAVPTTLSFYIVERVQNTPLATIEYQVEQIAGRATTILTAWTLLDISLVTDSIYTFEYTLAAVASGASIALRFKTVDTDGQEAFLYIQDITIIS